MHPLILTADDCDATIRAGNKHFQTNFLMMFPQLEFLHVLTAVLTTDQAILTYFLMLDHLRFEACKTTAEIVAFTSPKFALLNMFSVIRI